MIFISIETIEDIMKMISFMEKIPQINEEIVICAENFFAHSFKWDAKGYVVVEGRPILLRLLDKWCLAKEVENSSTEKK